MVSDNENTQSKHVDTVKAVLRGKVKALSVYVRKQGKLRMIVKQGKEQQIKPKESGRKEIIEMSQNQRNSR